MTRLQPELDRLYGQRPSADEAPAGTRAAVLAVLLPVGWERLSAVWQGVQSDLALPAPAIAVSGRDALQLWFSFASPVPPAAGARFLQGLRQRYLPDVGSSQVNLRADAADLPLAPCAEISAQRWSAFVAPDLAAVFADTPWLDIPPTDEGQAALLRALEPMRGVDFEAALTKLGASGDDPPIDPPASTPTPAAAALPDSDPARFLTGVMTDAAAPLALRIEAARILLLGPARS